jgi:hypothetical protein
MGKAGMFLGVPYDWRRPTVARLKSRWWNPADTRLFTPKTYGWGFDINLERRVGRRKSDSAASPESIVNLAAYEASAETAWRCPLAGDRRG